MALVFPRANPRTLLSLLTSTLSGNVKDSSLANVSRKILLYRNGGTALLQSISSDAVTGNFSFTVSANASDLFRVEVLSGGSGENSVIFDRISPV